MRPAPRFPRGQPEVALPLSWGGEQGRSPAQQRDRLGHLNLLYSSHLRCHSSVWTLINTRVKNLQCLTSHISSHKNRSKFFCLIKSFFGNIFDQIKNYTSKGDVQLGRSRDAAHSAPPLPQKAAPGLLAFLRQPAAQTSLLGQGRGRVSGRGAASR